jgi:hypothetical protein
MFLHSHNALYIHQRKTGGVSIGTALGLHPSDPAWHIGNDGVLDDGFWSTVTAGNVFVFSSVRNPYDRAVSGWKYLASTRGRRFEEVLADPPATGHDYRHFTRPQVDILIDPATGNLVTDDIIRLESLSSDFRRMCTTLGIKPRPLHRHNRTWHFNYRHYYSDEARALVEQRFAQDLERFSYTF